MAYIIWKITRYLLRFCLTLLVVLFLFWLIKFKWKFIDYIGYLNTVDILQVLSNDKADSSYDRKNDLTWSDLTQEDLKNISDILSWSEEASGIIEDDYFLPEASSWYDEVTYGFSWGLDESNQNLDNTSDSPASKQDLVNLIKSREK